MLMRHIQLYVNNINKEVTRVLFQLLFAEH